jgi:hypothetical protein
LEKSILSVITPEDKDILFKDNTTECPNVQYVGYLNWLKEKEYINQDDYDLLSEIRNKFCHNEFPDKAKFKSMLSSDVSQYNFSQQIVSWYENKINMILENLSK